MQDLDSTGPDLSVVVVTVYNSTHLTACLNALRQQVDAPHMEIIAVYHDRVEHVETLHGRFPEVKFYCVSGRQTQPSLRAFGVSRARGRVVAITVDHCTPDRNWCTRIIKAHEAPFAALGGAIEKGSQPDTLANWAVHLYDYCNYGYYMNPIKNGPARDLSDCNASYKRHVLVDTKDSWQEAFNVSLLNRELHARGETLQLSSEIIVHQNRDIDSRRAIRIAFQRGRAFASGRLENSASHHRLVYFLFSPILPFMLLKRFLVNLLRKKSHFNIAVRALPLIALLSTLWSMGEFMSYLTGQKDTILAVTEE